ncbi:MAG: glycosyltransferase family 2 protein [Candidatus Bathyarchaeota archaeon]|nr:glycosyltransferase family 2 protein [Candidatus Bathyarchaeota archaeon]MDW8040612.1 glycosyltransferase family 2 protein [Nitrososphaerota archaeon]
MSKVNMVSFVIPTLNEAGTIAHIIETIRREVKYPHEIIVVDGNSTDETQDVVRKLNCCRLIIEPKRGYGVALNTGIKHARGDVVVIVDGDGTYEIRDVNLLVDSLLKENAELCLGARMNGLYEKSMDITNYIGNKLITFVFNLLYKQKLVDSQSGFRAIKRSALEEVKLSEEDMAFATEMLIKFAKRGFKIIEVSTTYKPRIYGKSKLKRVRAGLEIFKVLIRGIKD